MGNIFKEKSVPTELSNPKSKNKPPKDKEIKVKIDISDENDINENKKYDYEEIITDKKYSEEELFSKINKTKFFLYYAKLYKWDIIYFIMNFLSYCLYAFSLESCGYVSTNLCTDLRGMIWYFKVVSL